jgi:methyl-accepting chemotaxis protein
MGQYKDFIIYMLVLLGSIPLVRFFLILFFKKSVLKNIGFVFYLIIVFAAVLGRISAGMGIVHLLWQAPLTGILLTAAFMYVDRVNLYPVRKVRIALDRMKNGDFSNGDNYHNSLKNNDTEISEMYNSMTELKIKVGNILSEVSENSKSVYQTGTKLKEEAQNITKSAEEQALSISEIFTAISEVSAAIIENAHKSDQAEKIAKKSTVKIEVSNKNVQKAMESLLDIAKKVKVISDISFRTKILSLNADIEAAKAGEHGKGFQAVAGEVRKLSENSRKASEVIEKISQDSILMAERTGRIADQIVPDIKETADLVKEITNGSREQIENTELIKSSFQNIEITSQKFIDLSASMSLKTIDLFEYSEKMKQGMSFFSFTETEPKTDFVNREIEKKYDFSLKTALTSFRKIKLNIHKPNKKAEVSENQSYL